MENPQFLTLEKPGVYKKDDEETAEKYEKVERETFPLLEKIIREFETINKNKTKYTDSNRPNETVRDTYVYGSVKINIETVPQQKRVAAEKVIDHIEFWLEILEGDYAHEIKRKGVVTIDKKQYLSLNWTIAMINKMMEKHKEGKEGIKQTINFEAPDYIKTEDLEKVIYHTEKDYSKETEENALDYIRASLLKNKIKEDFYDVFREKALKKKLGYDKEKNMPFQTVTEYVRIGNHVFPIQVVPSTSASYVSALNTLIKETPSGKITKTTGELIRLREGRGDGLEKIYDMKKEKGSLYISLEALKTRIQQLREENIKPKLTYNIAHAIRLN